METLTNDTLETTSRNNEENLLKYENSLLLNLQLSQSKFDPQIENSDDYMEAILVRYGGRYRRAKNNFKINFPPMFYVGYESFFSKSVKKDDTLKFYTKLDKVLIRYFTFDVFQRSSNFSLKIFIPSLCKMLPNVIERCSFSRIKFVGNQFVKIISKCEKIERLKFANCAFSVHIIKQKIPNSTNPEQIGFANCCDLSRKAWTKDSAELHSILEIIGKSKLSGNIKLISLTYGFKEKEMGEIFESFGIHSKVFRKRPLDQ
ncbi:unnamed protein product [Moneuplotes crassus]|uniref:Uncharacterized protein n=2 Tax=Euplotes crassus TaxID=5936 RepID=A0AAD2D3S0_EUPCR|nr:unnamed protein product [Moneuplotes crassus]